MRLHRFIVPFDCSQSKIELSEPGIVNQVLRVLRLGVGDRLILADGNANECLCEITDRHKDQVTVSVIERSLNRSEPVVAAVLYCAILKRENFELVAQKATEIGVREIIPVVTRRTVKLDIKEDRLQKIVREAAEQSGRGRVPLVHAPMTLAEALVDARRNEVNLFFDLSDVSVDQIDFRNAASRGLFVGPEGGWTEDEVAAARTIGCTIVSLGSLVLRAETAAIVATYLGTRD